MPAPGGFLPPIEGDRGHPAPVKQMTLDVKAKTLGYQLPHAEAEIQRIEELQRAKRDAFLKRRQQRPSERAAGLVGWLDRHADTATLQDLSLASASVPVRSVLLTPPGGGAEETPKQGLADNGQTKLTMEQLFADNGGDVADPQSASSRQPDSIGISRYQVRGDLQKWISQVEAMNERMIFDAGDFNPEEEALLHTALERHLAKAVNKNASRDEFLMKSSLKTMCEMLENMTRSPFAVPEDLPVKDQLDALERQVVDLYAKAMKRGGFIYGSQAVSNESSGPKKFESEGEIRKRQLAVGVAAAAQSQHILLTHVQLDQVLNAFYQQQLPTNKREKGRLERQLVQSMIREDNTTTSLRRRNKQLSEELEALQETMKQILDERQKLKAMLAPTLVPVPTSQGGAQKDDLQQTNEVIQTMAEVLAKKAVREMQGTYDALQQHSDEMERDLKALQAAQREVVEERDRLRQRLDDLEAQQAHQNELKRQQEEERTRMFGGMRSDQQYYQSTIHKILLQSSATLSEFVLLLGQVDAEQRHAHSADHGTAGRTPAPSHVDWETALSILDRWCAAVGFAFHFCDGARCCLNDVKANCRERSLRQKRTNVSPTTTLCSAGSESTGGRRGSKAASSQPAVDLVQETLNRQLVNDLAQRVDSVMGESRAKFREARYMRSFLWYLIHCFDAMLNGTYTDESHGKRKFHHAPKARDSAADGHKDDDDAEAEEEPFPPTSVIAMDSDYNYAWTEETTALERVFLGFRSRLVTSSEAQQGEVNSAVLRALEVVTDQEAHRTPKPDRHHSDAEPIQSQPSNSQHASGGQSVTGYTKAEVQETIDAIAALPCVSNKDVRLSQTLEDHQRLPSGARAVDVATIMLLQIKEAKGHFSGSTGEKTPATVSRSDPLHRAASFASNAAIK